MTESGDAPKAPKARPRRPLLARLPLFAYVLGSWLLVFLLGAAFKVLVATVLR